MDFYNYPTCLATLKKIGPSFYKNMDVTKFYEAMIKKFGMAAGYDRQGNNLLTFVSEYEFYKNGCPYYKIYPEMMEAMAEVSIEIPCDVLKLPYPSFEVKFPRDNKLNSPNPTLASLLVFSRGIKWIDENRFKYVHGEEGEHKALHVLYSFDCLDGHGAPLTYDYTMSMFNPELSIDDQFEKSWLSSGTNYIKGEYLPEKELCRKVIALAVATCFFGIDQHELVMPDLPRRKIEKLIQRNGLQDKKQNSNRDNTKKWSIGREISLPRPIIERKEVAEENKRSISHGYIKRGHMRWQAHGTGKKERKLIFVHPHVCRPDLPLQTKGYKIEG